MSDVHAVCRSGETRVAATAFVRRLLLIGQSISRQLMSMCASCNRTVFKDWWVVAEHRRKLGFIGRVAASFTGKRCSCENRDAAFLLREATGFVWIHACRPWARKRSARVMQIFFWRRRRARRFGFGAGCLAFLSRREQVWIAHGSRQGMVLDTRLRFLGGGCPVSSGRHSGGPHFHDPPRSSTDCGASTSSG